MGASHLKSDILACFRVPRHDKPSKKLPEVQQHSHEEFVIYSYWLGNVHEQRRSGKGSGDISDDVTIHESVRLSSVRIRSIQTIQA
jgi:hypothetical protein